MIGVHTKRMPYEKSDMHTGRVPCEHKGRDRGKTSTSQGTPKIAIKPLEAKKEAWKDYF